MDQQQLIPTNDPVSELIANQIDSSTDSARERALKKFGLAAVGAIPWVGGFVVAGIELRQDPHKIDNLLRQWLEHHAKKFQSLQAALISIAERLEKFGDEINARIESPEYLSLVDKGFRYWDETATEEKREYIRRLLANAAATSLCDDDLIRLFLDWIRRYDDTHFKVIKAIYNQHGISRLGIWNSLNGRVPRDNSSEADLFKLLIDDLALGHVIRQQRQSTSDGQFVKYGRQPRAITGVSPGIMKSPFDDIKPYELTELGSRFIHYVMNEVAPQIGDSTENQD